MDYTTNRLLLYVDGIPLFVLNENLKSYLEKGHFLSQILSFSFFPASSKPGLLRRANIFFL